MESGGDVGSLEATGCELLLSGDVMITGILGGVVKRISWNSVEVWALVTENGAQRRLLGASYDVQYSGQV